MGYLQAQCDSTADLRKVVLSEIKADWLVLKGDYFVHRLVEAQRNTIAAGAEFDIGSAACRSIVAARDKIGPRTAWELRLGSGAILVGGIGESGLNLCSREVSEEEILRDSRIKMLLSIVEGKIPEAKVTSG